MFSFKQNLFNVDMLVCFFTCFKSILVYIFRFEWGGPTQLADEYRHALIKGLPFPILTVAEYLAVDAEGFCWGRSYREAGYFTSIFLW